MIEGGTSAIPATRAMMGRNRSPRARLRYLQRVFSAYLGNQPSQLTFWHEPPQINENAFGPDAAKSLRAMMKDVVKAIPESGAA